MAFPILGFSEASGCSLKPYLLKFCPTPLLRYTPKACWRRSARDEVVGGGQRRGALSEREQRIERIRNAGAPRSETRNETNARDIA